MTATLVLINGRNAQAVSACDRGLHYGDGLFETIACLEGRPRLLEQHLERLAAGCRRLGLAGCDTGAVAAEVRQAAAGTDRAVVKVLVTRGVATVRGYAAPSGGPPTRLTLRYPWPREPPATIREGVRARIAVMRLGENPALAGLKHCNRLEQVLARREWTDPGIADSLMFSSSGALISGTMSNVFLVCAGRLRTPRVDRCGVAGIMRATVLRAAADAAISAEECVLDADDLARAEEIFLTNALIGIRPVHELEGRQLAPGPVIRHLQEALARILRAGLPGAAAEGA